MLTKFYFAVLVLILFSTTADSFAQLTKIWDRSNQNETFQWLCPKGKLAVVNRMDQDRLIDLTNGQTLYTVDNIKHDFIKLDNSGKRFFVVNYQNDELKVYNRNTFELIGNLTFRRYSDANIAPDDSVGIEFDLATNSLNFWNIYTDLLVDNFKIPNTPDKPEYSIYPNSEFSSDGRYFAFHIYKTHDATLTHFLLYDRQTREIIMQKNLPKDNFLNYRFFNTKNHMAYVENIKLPEDDKPYSYIRIFDLDKREVVKNIKMSNIENGVFYFLINQKDNLLTYATAPSNNTKFYDLDKIRKLDYEISSIAGPIYLDDSLYVTGYFEGYKFDRNAVSVEEEPNPNIPFIYPNPTTNSINLDIEPHLFNGQWQITDLTGRVILNGIILSNPQLQINIEQIPAQTYYLQLTNGSFLVTYQVVKL